MAELPGSKRPLLAKPGCLAAKPILAVLALKADLGLGSLCRVFECEAILGLMPALSSQGSW